MSEKETAIEDLHSETSEPVAEEDFLEMPEEPTEPDVETEDELTKAQREAEMYKDRWIRLAAEFDNYKRRTAREFEALIRSASEDVIRDLLPILDGVDRALTHRESGQAETEGYQEGVLMIMERFPKILQNRNLKEIETIGQPFDPNLHEALMQVSSDTIEAGYVTIEVEKGYSLGEKVLRHAKVVVSRGKSEAEAQV